VGRARVKVQMKVTQTNSSANTIVVDEGFKSANWYQKEATDKAVVSTQESMCTTE
jgi:hypothetical protein